MEIKVLFVRFVSYFHFYLVFKSQLFSEQISSPYQMKCVPSFGAQDRLMPHLAQRVLLAQLMAPYVHPEKYIFLSQFLMYLAWNRLIALSKLKICKQGVCVNSDLASVSACPFGDGIVSQNFFDSQVPATQMTCAAFITWALTRQYSIEAFCSNTNFASTCCQSCRS